MKPTTIMRSFAVAAGILTASLAPAQDNINDTIITRGRSRVRAVEVTEMTVSHVSYKKGETEGKVPSQDVVGIAWSDPPELFIEAQGKENNGDHTSAANLFTEAASKTDRIPIRLEAQFFGARAALASAGTDRAKVAAAQSALQAYLDQAAEGFYSPHAKLLISRALRLQGKTDEAEAALQALEAATSSAGLGVAWDARAKFERAQGLLAAGRAREARGTYQRVISAIDTLLATSGDDRELLDLKIQSLVREGESYIAENDTDQALAFFRKHTRAPSPGESTVLQAAALAGEGEAMFAKAAASGDNITMLREAQTVLARATILDTSNGDTTAKALYYSGKILQTLGPDAERDAKSRSMGYFDSVTRNYSNTRWAAKARAEVDG